MNNLHNQHNAPRTSSNGMWRNFMVGLLLCSCLATVAQPPARLKQQQSRQEKTEQTPTASAYREFPTAQPMPEQVAWRRDIYRSIDLSKDANAVLYFPTTPQNGQMNLFTFLFKQLLRGQIKAYDYTIDGNENLTEKNTVKAKELMDRYEIFYESKGDKVRVNDADIPSEQVKMYYLKESVYYDQHTASFRHKVTALCPVLVRGSDEFGEQALTYPMFWVKYDEIAPQLGKLMLMGSNYNNAAMMSADDYFTMNCYKGDIYKTTNLQDKILSNYCTTDSAMRKEQRRIERQLVDFEDRMWGRDSVAMAKEAAEAAKADSLAALEKDSAKALKRRSRTTGRRTSLTAKAEKTSSKSTSKSTKVKKEKKTRVKSTPSRSSRGGYSVRRERR